MTAALTSSLAIPHDPTTWAEIQRIVGLSISHPFTPEEVEYYNREHVQAAAYDNGFRLDPLQAMSVATYEIYDGLFAPIAVGGGKTLISLMCACIAFSKGLERILLHVPSPVLSQLVQTDIPWARSRVHINYPIHVLGGKSRDNRRAIAASTRKGLYIMPYSLLSTEDASENLEAIDPQLTILDEAHNLANHSAARTRRVVNYWRKRQLAGKQMELVILSGTITGKSIKDYYHLIKPCLKENCPLPLSDRMTTDWALLVDAVASGPEAVISPLGAAPIQPVVQWARQNFPKFKGGFSDDVYGFRKAFQCRLNSAPGVVASGDASIGTSLIFQNRPVEGYASHPDFPLLKQLIDQVEDMWQTPNGDEIEFAIHKWKWLNELSCGFYNELTWPSPEVYAKRKGIAEFEAGQILERAKMHHLVNQEYAKLLRHFLEHTHRVGCDTPFLVGQEMMRNGDKSVGAELYRAWKDAKDLEFEGMPDRDARGVRVCDYKIQASVAWAKELQAKKEGGVIWYHSHEIGEWMTEYLHAAGMGTALHCPAGEQYNKLLRIDDSDTARKKDMSGRILVASIGAHAEGKNLQYMQNMLVLQWPRPAKKAEQLIGRLHRRGQQADELYVRTMQTLAFDEQVFAACLNDSLYIHQSTGNRQKLIYAAYDPRPRIFPPAVLDQRGLEIVHLSPEDQKVFNERFLQKETQT